MLYGNSMFNIVATTYMKDKQASLDKIKELIKKYEEAIRKRVKIQDIGKEKPYLEVLNDSISFIEYADNMCSWTEQIMLTVKMKKDIVQKKYDLESIKAVRQIETLQEILECTSKTEKEKLKIKKLKENLIDLEHELDAVKMHLEFCKIFVNDAARTREHVYAYYQAVKNRGEVAP